MIQDKPKKKDTMKMPDHLKYTNEHEWISVEGDVATVGITSFAQGELGDIVFVEIETEGETLAKGETFGTIEAVKTVSDLFMPVGGKVVEINPALEASPELVNKDPFGAGWLIKVAISDSAEFNDLLSAEQYEALLEA